MPRCCASRLALSVSARRLRAAASQANRIGPLSPPWEHLRSPAGAADGEEADVFPVFGFRTQVSVLLLEGSQAGTLGGAPHARPVREQHALPIPAGL